MAKAKQVIKDREIYKTIESVGKEMRSTLKMN
jgi:hypothetical protein